MVAFFASRSFFLFLSISIMTHSVTSYGETTDTLLHTKATTLFKALPETMSTDLYPTRAERVKLGRKLFFDKRLSLDGSVSCETCHIPALHATDGLPKSIGVEHRANLRNAPTLLNAALQFTAHWDGSRATVEDQASKSFTGKLSFGNPDEASVVHKLMALGYEHEFRTAFADESPSLSIENLGRAIGSYERTLISPSPFDNYLKGDTQSISSHAKEGLNLFIDKGCASCHNGTLLGGNSYQKFGITKSYWLATHSQSIDEGRFKITQNDSDLYVFKTPSLRNVAMTPPYFHDGSIEGLDQAISIMADVQLGLHLNQAEVESIQSFLESLTGRIPSNFSHIESFAQKDSVH